MRNLGEKLKTISFGSDRDCAGTEARDSVPDGIVANVTWKIKRFRQLERIEKWIVHRISTLEET